MLTGFTRGLHARLLLAVAVAVIAPPPAAAASRPSEASALAPSVAMHSSTATSLAAATAALELRHAGPRAVVASVLVDGHDPAPLVPLARGVPTARSAPARVFLVRHSSSLNGTFSPALVPDSAAARLHPDSTAMPRDLARAVTPLHLTGSRALSAVRPPDRRAYCGGARLPGRLARASIRDLNPQES